MVCRIPCVVVDSRMSGFATFGVDHMRVVEIK